MKIFVASQEGLRIAKLIDTKINLLYSAINLRPVRFPDNIGEVFCDCGAFYLFTKYGRFPYKPKEYANYVNKMDFDWVSTMDIPCEGRDHPTQKIPYKSNEERIKITVENTRILSELIPKEKFYPVVQGYSVKEYEYCMDMLDEYGLVKDKVAVGSLCIRKKVERIKTILRAIRRHYPNAKIHAFGLTLLILRDKAFWREKLVDSFDTGAWSTRSTKGVCYVFSPLRESLIEFVPRDTIRYGRKIPTEELSFLTLKNYLEYFEYLKHKFLKESSLVNYPATSNVSSEVLL